MRVKQKFKVRIEDPPRRRHMVFLGGAVLANIVSRETPNNICNHQIAILTIISTDGRQGKHVDIQGRVARTRCPCPGQIGRSMKKRRQEASSTINEILSNSIRKPRCTFFFHGISKVDTKQLLIDLIRWKRCVLCRCLGVDVPNVLALARQLALWYDIHSTVHQVSLLMSQYVIPSFAKSNGRPTVAKTFA